MIQSGCIVGARGPGQTEVNGVIIGAEFGINLIAGANITIVGVDNPTTKNIDVTITGATFTAPVTSVFGRTGAVVAQASDYIGFYLSLDQTLQQTVINGAPIFGAGWISTGNVTLTKATPTFTIQNSGVTSVTLSSDGTNFIIQAGTDSASLNGADVRIIGGTAALGGGGNGAFVRLVGGGFDPFGDILNNGFVTTGTSITSFSGSNTVSGSLIAGNTINDFACAGNFYAASSAIFANDGIGVGGRLCPTGYMLLGKGTANMIIGMDRAASGAGFALTIQAGWALSSSNNQTGGNLILAAGKATGNGIANVVIQAVGGGGSGTTDRSPTTVATWGFSTLTLLDGYIISTGSGTGLKIGSATTDKVGFFNVAPVAQQANSVSLEAVLSNFGLRVSGSAAPITVGVFSSTSTTDSTSPTTGGGKFSGGVGIAKALWVGTNISINTAGNGFQIKEGANAKMGTGTLVGGTVVINTTAVTANSRIFISDTGGGVVGNIGALYANTIVAGTSFTVTSTNPLDTSTFNWLIIEKL